MSSGGFERDHGLVERIGSGLLVPNDLMTSKRTSKGTVHYDPDGRRRVVIDKAARRMIDRLTAWMKVRGVGFVMACREDISRGDDVQPCGQVMLPEGRDTPDEGYGCQCTRIHVGT